MCVCARAVPYSNNQIDPLLVYVASRSIRMVNDISIFFLKYVLLAVLWHHGPYMQLAIYAPFFFLTKC